MTSPDVNDLAMRVREAGRAVMGAACDVERTPWGLFVWNDAYPLLANANSAWVLQWPDGLEPGEVFRGIADRFRGRGRRRAYVLFGESPHSDRASSLGDPLRGAGFEPNSVDVELVRLRTPDYGPTSRVRVHEAKEPEDRESCWALARTSLEREGRTAEEVDQWMGMLRRRHEALGARFLLAISRDEPAGFATLVSRARFGYLDELYAAPAHRRRGVGSALLLAAMRASAVAGDGHLGVTTASTNDAALRLYGKLGFDAVGTRLEFVCDAAAKTL